MSLLDFREMATDHTAHRQTDDEREKKRMRTENKSVVLNVDVFSIIMSWLAPREMLCLATCSKDMIELVKYEHVVNSSIVMEGRYQTSIQSMIKLLQEQKIFHPSPLRLLRIANGRRCEFPNCDAKVRVVRPSFGLFICRKCATRAGITCAISQDEFRTDLMLIQHHRTARGEHRGKIVLIMKPFFTSDDERAGPLVTRHDIDRLLEQQCSIEEHVEGLVLQDNHVMMECILQQEGQSLARVQIDERTNMERTKECRLKKMRKIQEKLSQLKNRLRHPIWKHFILRHSWFDKSGQQCDPETGVVCKPEFDCKLLCGEKSLKRLVEYPSRTAVETMVEIGDRINRALTALSDAEFPDFSFLSDDCVGKPFEASLRAYVTSKYSIQNVIMSLVDEDLDLLKFHSPLMALAAFVSGEKHLHTIPPVCFAGAVLVQTNMSEDHLPTDLKFAEIIWSWHAAAQENQNVCFYTKCQQTYDLTVDSFNTTRSTFQAYLRDPQTRAFLRSSENMSHQSQAWLRTKRRTVQEMWTDKKVVVKSVKNPLPFENILNYHHLKAIISWKGRTCCPECDIFWTNEFEVLLPDGGFYKGLMKTFQD